MDNILELYKNEVEKELHPILPYWIDYAVDTAGGSFVGHIDGEGVTHPDAPKGLVLTSRILWSFSAAYKLERSDRCRQMAERAYHYLIKFFIDQEYGGVYWTVDDGGAPLYTKKPIYAQAFAIYGLSEYAAAIGNKSLAERLKNVSVRLADAAARGLDADGGLWYDWTPGKEVPVKEKHWWPQAEAMVGFVNAWENSGNVRYLDYSIKSWAFVKKYIRDEQNGEWRWGVYAEYSPMRSEDKVGLWKCPYHNSRACIELRRRLSTHVAAINNIHSTVKNANVI